MKIIVINLASARDRRAHMEAQLHKAGLQAHFFNAFSADELKDKNTILAALLSHKGVWESIDCECHVLVLEDDVILHDSFYAHLAKHIEQLPGSYDVAFVGYGLITNAQWQSRFPGWRFTNDINFHGAYAYLVNGKQGAAKLLELLEQTRNPMPDMMMKEANNSGELECYFLTFPMVKHGGFESTINHNKTAVPVVTDEILGGKPAKKSTVNSRQSTENTTAPKVRLFINWYNEADKVRAAELEKCLFKNVHCAAINEIINLSDTPTPFGEVTTVHIKPRPTYADFIKTINKLSGKDDINIIANLDIYFDETIKLAAGLGRDGCYALSRWDVDANFKNAKLHEQRDSQDVWVFKGKVKTMKEASFHLGLPGCDNRLAYLLQQVGYKLSNPSKSIKTYHMHNSPVRHGTQDKKVKGKYAFVVPVELKD